MLLIWGYSNPVANEPGTCYKSNIFVLLSAQEAREPGKFYKYSAFLIQWQSDKNALTFVVFNNSPISKCPAARQPHHGSALGLQSPRVSSEATVKVILRTHGRFLDGPGGSGTAKDPTRL